MHWSDEGLVVGIRRQGETSVVLEVMTREHGRHFGLVHGGRSRRMQPVLQPGNAVRIVWRARLDEQLGTFAVEPVRLRTGAFLEAPLALYGIGTLASHLRLLPERDPHPTLFDMACLLAEHLHDEGVMPGLFVRFELALLAELGFGLDLDTCVATGQTDELIYVSPRSGRAVSREAGEPYRTKLLALPPFLRGAGIIKSPEGRELAEGFALTGRFLSLHVYEPRGQSPPAERLRFVSLASRGRPSGVSDMFRNREESGDSARDGEV